MTWRGTVQPNLCRIYSELCLAAQSSGLLVCIFRPDLLLHKNGIEFSSECGKDDVAGAGERKIVEGQLHCPKTTKYMFVQAAKKEAVHRRLDSSTPWTRLQSSPVRWTLSPSPGSLDSPQWTQVRIQASRTCGEWCNGRLGSAGDSALLWKRENHRYCLTGSTRSGLHK